MATVTTSLPRARSIRLGPVVTTALLCAASAGLYAWMRAPAAVDLRAYFADWCRRLEMQPQDWPCRVTGTQMLAAYAGGSLLIGVAVALPGVILAATGRRLTALVPLLAAGIGTAGTAWFTGGRSSQALLGVADMFFGGDVGHTYWHVHGARAVVADLMLLSVPALAVAVVLRPSRRARPDPLPRHAAWLATFSIAAAVVAVVWLDGRLHGSSGLLGDPLSDRWIPVVVMALFAAMLGTDRRWWPWALAPTAVLLSLGPAMAVMSTTSRFTAFAWFGATPMLAAVGLLASLWRPLATRFAGPDSGGEPTRAEPRREVRPVVVLNALAVSLLVIAVVAQRADPLPIQIAEPLPTYLGERMLAADVRAKTNLHEAVAAMEAYRAGHGTYRGFDAAVGEEALPTLAWYDGVPTGELVVGVTAASTGHAQVVTLSVSGNAFCAQVVAAPSGADLTYGSSDRRDVARARADCGSTPWTSAATRMFDVEAMCEGADDQTILICRAAQKVIRTTLGSPVPA